MAEVRVERRTTLSSQLVTKVRELVEQATEADGVRPVSEHVLLHLRGDAHHGLEHLLLWHDSTLVGYAQFDSHAGEPSGAELAVAPDDHAAGHSQELIDALLDGSPNGLRLWAHGDGSSTARVASGLGFTASRVLFQLRRSLTEQLPESELPDGVTVRTFEVGRDEDAWLAVNNRAFASHPDQSDWTRDDIDVREREPWFEPAGFFLAERAGELVGFHWTKVHGASGHQHEPIGEVYVIGVNPSMQGQHLSRPLTMIGLRYLRDLGLKDVMLYVDESNQAALALYQKLGFSRFDTDICFTRDAERPSRQ